MHQRDVRSFLSDLTFHGFIGAYESVAYEDSLETLELKHFNVRIFPMENTSFLIIIINFFSA